MNRLEQLPLPTPRAMFQSPECLVVYWTDQGWTARAVDRSGQEHARMDIPPGFNSGYLRLSPGVYRIELQGHDGSSAWLELPVLGGVDHEEWARLSPGVELYAASQPWARPGMQRVEAPEVHGSPPVLAGADARLSSAAALR